ncbi:hypothetical protein BCR44DRAFT_1523173 [Catenaria anguillulae PL171]|uniref:Uncharacterized protein n=1 Tax=Catenaria anguillulae PL171 TaxID=765915 RepID=A0A1Y2H5U0_9FUNG|nr:hypothetical protein BCR44DRAFT_1523173 [Catenaria anguillulae PL171]
MEQVNLQLWRSADNGAVIDSIFRIVRATVVVSGGVGIGGNINAGGNLGSTTVSNGALIIAGGAGIAKNLNVGGALVVGGNTTINGNLVVNGGSITEIRTSTLSVNDNVILINAGPQSSADGGVGIKRFQTANNTGEGDVVNNDVPEVSGTARTGSTSTTIVLASSASAINDFYKDSWIRITSGTGSGQVRRIKQYDGASKVATLYSTADQTANNYSPVEGMDWDTIPDVTSQYAIYDTQYILTYYDESGAEYVFGSTPQNPANTINEHSANAGVTIEGVNVRDGAMTGTTTHGSYLVLRMAGVKGSNDENLDITWPAGESPRLRHLLPISGASGANIQFVCKLIDWWLWTNYNTGEFLTILPYQKFVNNHIGHDVTTL